MPGKTDRRPALRYKSRASLPVTEWSKAVAHRLAAQMARQTVWCSVSGWPPPPAQKSRTVSNSVYRSGVVSGQVWLLQGRMLLTFVLSKPASLSAEVYTMGYRHSRPREDQGQSLVLPLAQ